MTDFSPAPDELLILSLGNYEGPLDLLLGLARQRRVDLKHISMTALAQQYLDFVAQATRLHLAVKAEYLVMATHLARMKARLLLPRDKDENTQGEQSATALRENLLWLEQARHTARFFRTLPRLGSEMFACGAAHKTLPESVVEWERDSTLFELLQSYVAIERRRDRQAKRLRIRSLRLYDAEEARGTLKAQLDGEWRDLLHLIPASVYRRAEQEENPTLFLKSIVSGFFSAALDLSNNKGAPKTARKGEAKNVSEGAYAEFYQQSGDSPLQLRMRGKPSSSASSPASSSVSTL